MNALPPTSTQFFAQLHVTAALYGTRDNWAIGDLVGTPQTVALSSLGDLTSTDEIASQIYVDPISITIPTDDTTKTKWIVVLSVGSGGTLKENRQAHVFRIDSHDPNLVVGDYMGAFGGAANNDVANVDRMSTALAAPGAGSATPKGKITVLQAPFNLINTLTQHQDVPVTANVGASVDVTFPSSSTTPGMTPTMGTPPPSVTSNSAQVDLGLDGGIGFGWRFAQTTPPPPTFVVTFNAFVGTAAGLAEFVGPPAATPTPPAPSGGPNLVLWVPFEVEGQTALSDNAAALIRAWVDQFSPVGQAQLLNAIRLGQVPLHVTGYASHTGPAEANVNISRQRVDAVRGVLQGGASASGGNRMTGGILGGETLRLDVRAMGQVDADATKAPWVTPPPSSDPFFGTAPLPSDLPGVTQTGRTVQIVIDQTEATAGIARLTANAGISP